MARLPYADLDDLELAPLVDRIVQERGKVMNLYAMLLHSPPVAKGWLNFLTAIRQQCDFSSKIRELVILNIAVINKADYEFDTHAPIARAEGVTPEQIDALRKNDLSVFNDLEKAALTYSKSMTQDIDVPETIFNDIKNRLSTRHMVELTATIAAYNLVSRFLEALRIDPDEQ